MRPLEINDSVILVSGKHERYISCGVQKDSLFFFFFYSSARIKHELTFTERPFFFFYFS